MPSDITSRTVVLPGDRTSATARTTISRSVTMPTRRSFSPTGRAPTLSALMHFAASRMVILGSAMRTVGVMISWTCMVGLLMLTNLQANAGGLGFVSGTFGEPLKPSRRSISRTYSAFGHANLTLSSVTNTGKVPLPTNDHQKAACESATFPSAVALCSATFVAFQPTIIGVDYMAALLGNLPGTVDGLLGTATGVLGGTSGSASASASGTADLSHTLDLGAVIETSPSIDLSTPDLAGLGGI